MKDILDIINVWPSEVFHSGLVWAPAQSFIRKTYLKAPAVRIVCGHRADWSACELTIRGHSDVVNSVAVSPDNRHIVSGSWDNTIRIWNVLTGKEEPPLVISFVVCSDNCHAMSGSQVNAISVTANFLSTMVISIAHFAQGDNIMSIPVIEKLVSGESLQLELLLQALSNGLSPVPVTFSPDGLSILLSNGKKCLVIPSTLRDIHCAAFSGSRAYFGHGSGRLTILDIST